jgi:hypothetical protein
MSDGDKPRGYDSLAEALAARGARGQACQQQDCHPLPIVAAAERYRGMV